MSGVLGGLTMLGRVAGRAGVPRLVGRLAPRVNARFPQLAGRGTAFGARTQAIMNSRPLGNIPGVGRVAKWNPTVFGRSPLNPTIRGTQYNLLNPKFGTGARALEWPFYSAAWARTNFGPQFDARMREIMEDKAPGTTAAWDSFFGDEDPTEEEQADGSGGSSGDGSGLGSADYSAYEESLRNAGNAASVNLSGLQQQYDQVIDELKSQYQLAETEEEKERIRYIVADVEAQREAGEKAIGEIYATKIQEIQKTAAMSREETGRSAQAAGDVWRQGAQDLRQGAQTSRDELVAQNRGLGIGAPGASGADPFVNLMSGMAPVSQNYAQRIGDIGAQAIDFMGATAQGQEGAQQADLRRLAVATSSAARTQHASEVAQRIATERLAMNQQIAALRSQQMGDISSGRELNAQLADSAANRRDARSGDLPPRMEALVEARSWGRENPELTYDDYAEWHEERYGVPPGEDARAAYELGVTERE